MNTRQQSILQRVMAEQKVSVVDLAKTLSVSVVTIRHDLDYLEQGNYLKRIHGFAVAIDNDNIDARMMTNYNQKKCLAELAVSFIEYGEAIFLEGGSTNAIFARILRERADITVITVNTYIANLLRGGLCNVILLGGLYQKKTECIVGPLVYMALQTIHFSKSFIGIDGCYLNAGFSGRDMMRAEVINAVLGKSSENIILTDSSKFGHISSYPIGPIDAIDRLITDNDLEPDYISYLESNNIKCHVVFDKL